jgi:uncharacterized protein YjbJ (UPF0337 family)
MNWNEVQAKWMLFKGSVKQEWGKLTDDDLDYIAGTRDRLIGRLEEKHGLAKEEAERRADRWLTTQQNPTRALAFGFREGFSIRSGIGLVRSAT